jgi:hypothetical protein
VETTGENNSGEHVNGIWRSLRSATGGDENGRQWETCRNMYFETVATSSWRRPASLRVPLTM